MNEGFIAGNVTARSTGAAAQGADLIVGIDSVQIDAAYGGKLQMFDKNNRLIPNSVTTTEDGDFLLCFRWYEQHLGYFTSNQPNFRMHVSYPVNTVPAGMDPFFNGGVTKVRTSYSGRLTLAYCLGRANQGFMPDAARSGAGVL